MSTKEVLAIAIKLFSLWVLVQAFWLSPSLIVLLSTFEHWQGGTIPGWVYVALLAAFIGVGIAISLTLYKVANSVLATSSSEGDATVSHEAQKYLLQLGGVYFLVSGLVSFLPSIGFMWQPDVAPAGLPFHYFLRPFSLILEAAIGLWLVVHPSWWTVLLRKLRSRA